MMGTARGRLQLRHRAELVPASGHAPPFALFARRPARRRRPDFRQASPKKLRKYLPCILSLSPPSAPRAVSPPHPSAAVLWRRAVRGPAQAAQSPPPPPPPAPAAATAKAARRLRRTEGLEGLRRGGGPTALGTPAAVGSFLLAKNASARVVRTHTGLKGHHFLKRRTRRKKRMRTPTSTLTMMTLLRKKIAAAAAVRCRHSSSSFCLASLSFVSSFSHPRLPKGAPRTCSEGPAPAPRRPQWAPLRMGAEAPAPQPKDQRLWRRMGQRQPDYHPPPLHHLRGCWLSQLPLPGAKPKRRCW